MWCAGQGPGTDADPTAAFIDALEDDSEDRHHLGWEAFTSAPVQQLIIPLVPGYVEFEVLLAGKW